MRIFNANIYGTDGKFHEGSLRIRGGIITDVSFEDGESGAISDVNNISKEPGGPGTEEKQSGREDEQIDARGMYVIPGLIDLHFHGASGYDVCDGTPEAFRNIAAFELSQGVTSICPATMTLPEEVLLNVLSCGRRFSEETAGDNSLSELVGFNMEGPFISHAKKGAQNEEYIRKADIGMAERFLEASGGLLKIIGLAPEESPDFEEYIRAVKDRVIVSLAHTNADYDTAMRAIRAGAKHAVHLYNAMSPLSHRTPGVVNAVFDSGSVNAELICDGIHLHPSAVRTALRELTWHQGMAVFISDSLRAAGMPDGEYELGGQTVRKEGKLCTLCGAGTIAGSVSSLYDCMVNVVKTMDIPIEEAVRCSSTNPARVLGLYDRLGEIAAGKQADLVVMDRELNRKMVFKRGRLFR
ncbi:MAG: N-acetylglucosamine-6-phosphate deacetylase [Lachnospiraceae bacterium]|nr:N-acetylglucosamine-6-phosphate deacetylase [Lachnospiraceae bacterium]